ncbi:MAG: hypothetical protein CMO80_16005 [Verrucomicrobiales bacterium]|nr:hypothetical protein [Verrucomicrobiales bacterium]|tara:strand:- start:169 stop:417 length:249 start_codon:yes stop_codon:yes gene_type:complete
MDQGQKEFRSVGVAFLVLLFTISIWIGPLFYKAHVMRNAMNGMMNKLKSLRSERPENVSEQNWKVCVDWGVTGFGQSLAMGC